MMPQRVLISGGAGFIGSRLALRLRADGCHVTVLDNLSKQVHGPDGDSPIFRSIRGAVEFIKGDVRDKSSWEEALRGQDAVVHLAAETGTGQSMYEIERYIDVNERGTAGLLEILVRGQHAIRKIVVASSRAVYGDGKYRCAKHGYVFPGIRLQADLEAGDFSVKCPRCGKAAKSAPTDEESPLHPISIYGMTKRAQEEMTLLVGRALSIPAVALRFQNVYGPGQSMSNPYTGILSIFTTRIRNGNDIEIYEDGKESRDFVFVDDAVEALCLALSRPSASGVFNVGSGTATSVMAVAQSLIRRFGSSARANVTGKFRLGDIRHNTADLRKARKALGFRPRFSFDQGLELFCRWAQEQVIEKDHYEVSREELRLKGLLH